MESTSDNDHQHCKQWPINIPWQVVKCEKGEMGVGFEICGCTRMGVSPWDTRGGGWGDCNTRRHSYVDWKVVGKALWWMMRSENKCLLRSASLTFALDELLLEFCFIRFPAAVRTTDKRWQKCTHFLIVILIWWKNIAKNPNLWLGKACRRKNTALEVKCDQCVFLSLPLSSE